MVTMVVELPYSKAEFVQDVQDKFKAGVARAAETTKDKVVINNVSEKAVGRRRLLDGAVNVDFSVETESEAAATMLATSDKLSLESLNTALEAEGVQKITKITADAKVEVPEEVPEENKVEVPEDSAGWVAAVPSMLILAAMASLQVVII